MGKETYLIAYPMAVGGTVNPLTLTGTASSARREVIEDSSPKRRIGAIHKIFNGWYKGRKVFGWLPYDASGKRIEGPWHAVPGYSEKQAVEIIVGATLPT